VRSISLYLSLSPYPLLCYRAAISWSWENVVTVWMWEMGTKL
jgi:hypothetical protein